MKKQAINRSMFAMPYIIIAALFVVFPLFLIFGQAFKSPDGSFTFNNFKVIFDGVNMKVLGKSLVMAFLNTLICFVVAYPLAFILAKSKANKSAILVLLFIVPMWINFLLRTYALKTLLDLMNIRLGYFTTMVGMVYDFFPFMLLPIYTVLVNMDKSFVEAANDLGAGPVATFVKITLRLSVPGIISGALMVFMPTISSFAIVKMLGSADVYIFGSIIDSYFRSDTTWGVGAVMSLVMMVLVAITMVLAKLVSRGRNRAILAAAGGSLV